MVVVVRGWVVLGREVVGVEVTDVMVRWVEESGAEGLIRVERRVGALRGVLGTFCGFTTALGVVFLLYVLGFLAGGGDATAVGGSRSIISGAAFAVVNSVRAVDVCTAAAVVVGGG